MPYGTQTPRVLRRHLLRSREREEARHAALVFPVRLAELANEG
jgi:hypothetical protein